MSELGLQAAGFPGVWIQSVSWSKRVQGQVGGCGQHLVIVFPGGFLDFFHLEGTLELFLLFVCLAMLCSLQDVSSLTRD